MSIEKINELLNKQKIVETMLHSSPNTSRQGLVEIIVHRQHLSELRTLLTKLPAGEIARVLEKLAAEDADTLWKQLPEDRENDVLWELSEPLRQQLAGDKEPGFTESEMNAFVLREGRLQQVEIRGRKDLQGTRPLWVDLLNVSKAERSYIGEHFGLTLPDAGDMTDLEVSSRFRIEENDQLFLHSNFLLDREDQSRSVPVAFILHQGILFSLRNEELPVFRLQRRRARLRQGYVKDCYDLLLDLYGADVEYCADSLEDIYSTLSQVSKQVLSENMSDQQAAAVLADIAEEENLNGQIRSNILDTQRALVFLIQSKVLSRAQLVDTQQILRNIESLNSHTAFLFDKINFLMDATIGFININQNRRVSQLTIFGTVFMPLNIIAGIGGMSEFSMMTGNLPWPFAYGGLLVGMGIVGWITYVVLKHYEARKIKPTGIH